MSQLQWDYVASFENIYDEYEYAGDIFEIVSAVLRPLNDTMCKFYDSDIFKRYVELNENLCHGLIKGVYIDGETLGFEVSGMSTFLSNVTLPDGVVYDSNHHIFVFDSASTLFIGVSQLAFMRGDMTQHSNIEACIDKMCREVHRREMIDGDDIASDLISGFSRCRITS